MGFAPCARRIFVGFAKRRVDMDRSQYLIQPQPMLHGQNEFRNDVTSMCSDNGNAKNLIFAGNSQDFDKAMRFAIGDGAVKIVEAIGRDFVGYILHLSFSPTRATSGSVNVVHGIML